MNQDGHIVSDRITGRDALEAINKVATSYMTVLFITDKDQKLVGTLTDGDIRRGLLKGLDINGPVTAFMNKQFKFLQRNADYHKKLNELKAKILIRFVPLLDNDMRILRVLDLSEIKSVMPVEAVLMAGGEGVRLKPLTDKTPKPLLKVGDKPIIRRNIDRLKNYGVNRFHLSVNYLADKIIAELGDGSNEGITINYVREPKPMGTIGSVKLIDAFASDAILVMNSDLLTNIDFDDFYSKFQSAGADMLVATVPYTIDVPYAVMDIGDKEEVLSFMEKPRYTYYSNAGIYLMKRELLNLIPDGQHFDATHFMEKVIGSGKKLVSYPILGYWLDIGRIEDFNKAQEDIKHIRF